MAYPRPAGRAPGSRGRGGKRPPVPSGEGERGGGSSRADGGDGGLPCPARPVPSRCPARSGGRGLPRSRWALGPGSAGLPAPLRPGATEEASAGACPLAPLAAVGRRVPEGRGGRPRAEGRRVGARGEGVRALPPRSGASPLPRPAPAAERPACLPA